MKKNIHPNYYKDITVNCVCGASYIIGSTKETFSIEVCSNCHPFFTGKQRLLDSSQRVEKFQNKVQKKATAIVTKTEKKARRATKKATKTATVTTDEKKSK